MPRKQIRKTDELQKLLIAFLWAVGVIVLLLILFIGFSYSFKSSGAFVLISGAYFSAGLVLGFLFGMPRSNKYRYNPKAVPGAAEPDSPWYTDNTNLEDISDWLTKIIVGLTLVSFDKILYYTHLAARSISMNISGSYSLAYSLSYGLIVLFIVAGFIISYLWSFTILRSILIRRKKDDEELTRTVTDMVSAGASHELVNKQRNVFSESELPKEENERAPQAFIELVNKALDTHRVLVPDDLQKNRWGGKNINADKELDASVKESTKYPRFFDIQLKVCSTNKERPYEGWVAFFVHDSFGFEKDTIYARAVNGEAQAPLVAYEAFTAGALCEDGTELELDLNEMKYVPEKFRWKE
jgi:hypothetical protein